MLHTRMSLPGLPISLFNGKVGSTYEIMIDFITLTKFGYFARTIVVCAGHQPFPATQELRGRQCSVQSALPLPRPSTAALHEKRHPSPVPWSPIMAVGMLSTRIAQAVLSTIGLLACALLGGNIVSRTLSGYADARTWMPTPARVSQAGMTGPRGAYCQVKYSYTSAEGAARHGDRTTLTPGGLAMFERFACARAMAMRSNGTATCFYDPSHADNSVLFRDMRHDVLATGMALLGAAGVGLVSLAYALDGLSRSRDPPWRVRSLEADLPPGLVARAAAAGTFAIISGTGGALCLADNDRSALWLVTCAGISAALCVQATRSAAKSKFAGFLVLPRNGKGATTLCIPAKLGGHIDLRAQWIRGEEEATELRFVDVRDDMPGLTEIDILTLPPMPERVASDGKAVVFISGKIGLHAYQGSFECGGEDAPRSAPPTPSTFVVIEDSAEAGSEQPFAHKDS